MTAVAEKALAMLKEIPFLKGVPDKMINDLLTYQENPASVVALPDGEYCIRQGEFGDTFYLILSGEMAVEVLTDEGTHREVARMQPGQIFGELAMIGRGHRTASVKAAGQGCEVLEIYKGPFDKLLKQKVVRDTLDEIYRRRTIEGFLRDNEHLRELIETDRKLIVDNGKLLRLAPMDTVYKSGDPPKSFYLVRQGFLKVSRMEGEVESILAYLRDKDFIGDLELIDGRPRGASVTAMEPAEVIELPRSVFATIYQRYPEVIKRFRRYENDRQSENQLKASSQTGMMFVKDLIELGMGQARSALIINMDMCTRCGNCVQACSDVHDGYSRLIRRGKKLTRREEESKALENIFFPNSCVHCRTPDCMSACPVGSIARDKEGEVYVKDFCIGCGGCAKACEFGNISMITIGDLKKAKPERKAVKCDICKGMDAPNCVYNCPQGAIIRVDPNEYFQELHRQVDLVAMAHPNTQPSPAK